MKNLSLRSICIVLYILLFSLNISWSQTPNRGGGKLNFSPVALKAPAKKIQKPQAGETILFLGNFNFDLDDDATSFRDLLTGRGYVITKALTPPSNITLSYLNQYDAIALYDLSGSVSASEADIFYSYVVNYSGNLLLLGQLTGFPSADRNMVGDKFGIHFNDDLFCDPENYYAYNGGCSESEGDPDNGVEYVRLQSFVNHPVTNNVSSFLLNWGQSLNVSGSAQALAFGSSSSWGDENPVWVEPPPDCYDGWYVNTDDYWEPHGNLVGVAAFESGGKVVGIGDQDMLWNFWFLGGQETLFGNIFSWFFQTQTVDITITTSPIGLQISVDGISYTSPQTFDWIPSSVHSISVSSPQSGGEGTRYIYDHWSDGGGQSHDITITTGSATYTAHFDTEYYLTMEVDLSEAGYVTPSSSWQKEGVAIEIEAYPNDGYYFSGWTGSGDGSYSGTSNPVTITMNGPITQMAQFLVDNITYKLDVIPKNYILYQNYPNPFNPSTRIVYGVPKKSILSIKLFDFLGRELLTLIEEEKGPGLYEVEFNASSLSSGIYFYVLQSGSTSLMKKMILIK